MEARPFGHYELRKRLGRGGMGEVYRAYDTRTDREVALKLLPPELAEDEAFQQRFRREAHAVAAITEPHVVPIHGYGDVDGRLYLDMRLVEGRTLDTVITEDGPTGLTPERCVRIVEQIGAALDAAHAEGITHRDVKPSNILVTGSDFAYLIDFGLARGARDSGLTTAGSTLGTLAYMAPERFDNTVTDPRSDIYALAAVFYECLTGERPFQGDSLEAQLSAHVRHAAPKPSANRPRLAAFDEVVAKGMAKNPERRYQTGAALGEAARKALAVPVRAGSGRHSAPTPTRTVTPKRLVVAAAALLILVGAVTGWWVWRDRSAQPPAPAPGDTLASIAAGVPQDIKDRGTLMVGVNVPYAPNEFRGADGRLQGFDIDLMNAIADTLNLKPHYRETEFDAIVTGVVDGDLDVGASSIADTRERERQVRMVGYLWSGTLWARRSGSTVDPAQPCGLRVGATSGLQLSAELPAKSAACVAAGLPAVDVVNFDAQNEVTAALLDGRIDAMSADAPVTGYAIGLSHGSLEAAGETFDRVPYGWAVAQGSTLTESLQKALQHLIDTGAYRDIAKKWGMETWMVERAVVDAAPR
ncbi:MAG: transporter substrate-binding domain-containing protein [Mycobacterium sp.]|nr:transporter substrate-binding domain-containing protein [Mycobacterium sp.]